MTDVQFYDILKQLWPAMLSAVKAPDDAIIIGQLGKEIQAREIEAKRAAETPAPVVTE